MISKTVARYRRQITFAGIGTGVAACGYVLLFVLIEALGASPHISYLLTAVVSIELSFILNGALTWGDRKSGLAMRSNRRRLTFHVARWLTVPLNQLAFSALVIAGVHWAIANTICILATALINYAVADRWVFRAAVR